MSRIRIVGDGTFRGTRVETLDGRHLEMVTGVEFKLDKDTQLAEAKVAFARVQVDIEADAPEVEG